MKIIRNLWNDFKTQPDVWFFYGFLTTFTLSIRKVIKFAPIAGQFNEYAGIYLYLSDIFLILTLLGWGIVILQNKSLNLSNNKPIFAFIKPLFTLLLLFSLWIFASIFWSDNQAIAIFRAAKILEFSLLFLYIAVRIIPPQYKCSTPARHENVPRGTFLGGWNILRGRRETNYKLCHSELDSESNSDEIPGQARNDNKATVPRGTFSTLSLFKRESWGGIFKIIIFLGLFQAIIGIWQFFSQHSFGMFWLKESLISPDLPGVAKIIFNGEKYIRAYGLFPHPNILGGFLVFSILTTWAYYKMFHPRMNVPHVPRGTYYGAGVEHTTGRAWNIVLHKFYPVVIGLQLLALLLTFSKSAIIGLIIAILYISRKIHRAGSVQPQYECSTWNILRGRRGTFYEAGVEHSTGWAWNILRGRRGTSIVATVKYYWKEVAIFLLTIFIGLNYLNLDWNTFLLKSLEERKMYLAAAWETISNNPYLGVGIGQSVLEINNNVPPARNADQECSTWNIACKQNITEEKYTAKIVAGGRETLLEPWQYQPVHNVFLLIWSELGLVGLILFCAFLYHLFRQPAKSRQLSTSGEAEKNMPPHQNSLNINTTNKLPLNKGENLWCGGEIYSVFYTLLKGFLFALLFISFFDHYFWDIQQGQILFWLALGLLSGLTTFPKSNKTC